MCCVALWVPVCILTAQCFSLKQPERVQEDCEWRARYGVPGSRVVADATNLAKATVDRADLGDVCMHDGVGEGGFAIEAVEDCVTCKHRATIVRVQGTYRAMIVQCVPTVTGARAKLRARRVVAMTWSSRRAATPLASSGRAALVRNIVTSWSEVFVSARLVE